MPQNVKISIEINPNYDAVCFHSQQAAEKIMKAVLIRTGNTPTKVHDLMILAKELKKAEIKIIEFIPDQDLIFLSRAAVVYRYPGEAADLSDAKKALKTAHLIMKILVKCF